MSTDGLQHSLTKLRKAGVHAAATTTFAHYYEMLARGEGGLLPEAEIEPVQSLPSAEDLPEADAPLEHCVVIKLNGRLGTSMGMTGPKSLLEVKDGLTFLDLAAQQVVALRESSGARLPLLLMNSFATREPSMAALTRFGGVSDFVQNRIPKLLADGLEPAEWPADPALEWCPPGHGDLFTALLTSGTLDDLLAADIRYAFVSNVDNVGAVVDPRILACSPPGVSPFAWRRCSALPPAARAAADDPATSQQCSPLLLWHRATARRAARHLRPRARRPSRRAAGLRPVDSRDHRSCRDRAQYTRFQTSREKDHTMTLVRLRPPAHIPLVGFAIDLTRADLASRRPVAAAAASEAAVGEEAGPAVAAAAAPRAAAWASS